MIVEKYAYQENVQLKGKGCIFIYFLYELSM